MYKFTFGFPCRNHIKQANEVIQLVLDNSDFDIVIIDDRSNDPDDEYVVDKRVRIMYNNTNVGLNALWNKILLNSSTEYIMIGCHKIRPKRSDFDIIYNKLEEGFACVATYRFGLFGFSKELTTHIGMFDEGYVGNNYEDTDLMNKLFINDLALYVSEETEYKNTGSTWPGGPENPTYYRGKWKEDRNTIVLLHEDTNTDDVYYNGESKTYLPWSRSELKVGNIQAFYKDKIGIRNVPQER